MDHDGTLRALAVIAIAALIATLAIVRYRQEPASVERLPELEPSLAVARLNLDEIRAAGY
jgi:hypothetical protein